MERHPKWVQKRRLKSWIGEISLERIGIIEPNRINPVIPKTKDMFPATRWQTAQREEDVMAPYVENVLRKDARSYGVRSQIG